MTPNEKLSIAGFITGEIGYPMYGCGATEEEAKRDAAYYTDARLPTFKATAELMKIAEADEIVEPWIVIDGVYCSKMAGCNWVRESIESGMSRDEMLALISEAFHCANPVIYPDGRIGMAQGDYRTEIDTAAFAFWAIARAA